MNIVREVCILSINTGWYQMRCGRQCCYRTRYEQRQSDMTAHDYIMYIVTKQFNFNYLSFKVNHIP